MENIEDKLLNLIRQLIPDKKAGTIEKGLKDLSNKIKDSEKDKDLKNLIDDILLKIIEGSTIIKDSLLGFKKIICQTLVEILKKKDFSNVLGAFLVTDNENFTKIMLLSILISNKIQITVFGTLFSILIDKNFSFLNRLLENRNIKNINYNKQFLMIINRYEIEDLFDKANNSEKVDLKKFLEYDNEDILNFINSDENNNENNIEKIDDNNIKKISSYNQENLETKNEENKINNTKDEEISNDKIKLNYEKNIRIDKLISSGIKIKCNQNLKEKEFLESNYQKIINDNTMKQNEIIIDDFECKDDSKLYLYSPISLIKNNIKDKFEKNDFEIFNSDNYYIELFGNYLENIIEKVNDFIISGREEEYIKENKIKFGCYKKNHFYLCCKFNEAYKQAYFEKKILNQNRYINNESEDNRIEIIQVQRKDIDDNNQIKQEENKNNNKGKYKSGISSVKISRDNYINKISNTFEKEVNDFISSEDCESLQNILFFFNLKIPRNKNEMKSVRLSFVPCSENSLYGFREIDICLRNKKERQMESQILSNNICYVYKEGKFNHKKNENIDVFLEGDSIIFCEVKNSFPNISNGTETCSKINVLGSSGNENSYQNLTYIDQLDNLIKKAKTFYYFFKDEKLIETSKYMHILYLYDFNNISFLQEEYVEIEDNIKNYIENLSLPNDFKNTIIQIAYFDKENNRKIKEKKLIDKIKTKDAEIKAKDNEIERLRENSQSKDEEIKKLKALLKQNNINYE